VRLGDWSLLPEERDNPGTVLDSRRTRAGDLLMFTDWRGDPDERLDGPGTEISRVLCEAAERGVVVRGLIWRSHLDKQKLEAWHEGGRRGPRPPGRLLPYRLPELGALTTAWAGRIYRVLFDPDGRPPALRRRGGF
jgi:hypothetical protein